MYRIINESEYIAVTFTGSVSFSELLDAFLRLTALPGFADKSRIWIFKGSDEASLSLATISSVMPIVKKLNLKNKKNKVAIVLQNGLHNAIAGLFDSDSSQGARRVDLFDDVDSAVQWVAA
jgi:hypothetical protein